MGKHRQTKATDIIPKVKAAVWERDCECCIICGSVNAAPCAHFIPRSAGGLGIEENIVTLCCACHADYDGLQRGWMRVAIADYLRARYDGWDEKRLVYKKYS